MAENDVSPILTQQTKLLEDIATLLRNQTQVPWEHVLWTNDDIAAYLKVSPRTVSNKYVYAPGFPRPVHPGGGYPRWYAHEIVDWVETTRARKPRSITNLREQQK